MQEEAHELFPARTALVPLAGLWGVALAGIFFFGGVQLRSFCGALFAAVLLWLAFVDLRDGMLYDVITVPLAAAGLIFSLMGALMPVEDAIIGGTLCGVLFYCLYIAARGGLGGGDVKLAVGLGIWLGWEAAIVAVWIAFLLGGLAAVFLLVTGRKNPRDGIPLGPFLAVGGYVGFVAGSQLWRLYWGLV